MLGNTAATNQGAAFDHERWLAMRAAYNQYKGASAILGALSAASPVGSSSPANDQAIAAAAAEQRAAFENYIEARLALSEYMAFPAQGGPATQGNALNQEIGGYRHNSRISRTVLLVAAAAWLLPAALGVENWVDQRKQVREIEAVRDEARAVLAQTTNQLAAFTMSEAFKTVPKATLANDSEPTTTGVKRTLRLSQTPALRRVRRSRRIARNHQKWVLLD